MDKLFLFACDQKIEHLSLLNPYDLFTIAAQSNVGALATHLGLVSQYGSQFPTVNYVIKLNGKTNLVPTAQKDPFSKQLWSVDQVAQFKKESKLPIIGVGLTVYVGSEFEAIMLETAAQVVYQAREHGLLSILWMYPRGKAVPNERDGKLIAGAAGVAASLGADFAKINVPDTDSEYTSLEWLAIAARAAGKTKLICSGGNAKDPETFLRELRDQILKGNMAGCAVGRNIHSRLLPEAITISKAIAEIVYG